MLNKNFEKLLESLEEKKQCGKKKLVTVLCDTTQTPRLYEIPSEKNRFLNEVEYQEWRKKLGSDVQPFLVKIYLNRPEVAADAET